MGCVSSKRSGKWTPKWAKGGLLSKKKNADTDETPYTKGSILRGDVKEVLGSTLPQLFKELLKGDENLGSRPAVVHDDKTITFLELDQQSDKLAKYIVDRFGKNEEGEGTIGVLIPASDERIVALLAILKAGYAYLPLEATIPHERMRLILNEAKPKALVTKGEFKEMLDSFDDACPKLVCVDDVEQEEPSEGESNEKDALPEAPSDDPIVAVYFTSGSTGKPKGVPLRTRSIMNRLLWQWDTFPYNENDVTCHKTSLLFIDSLTEIFSSLLRGVTMVTVGSDTTKDAEAFVDLLDKHKVTRLVLVPSLLKSLLTWLELFPEGQKLASLKQVVCSGEELPEAVAADFFGKLTGERHLVNLYGSTEVTGDVTYEVFTKADDVTEKKDGNHLSIGRPIWNTEVYVMSEDGEPVALGEIGELCIAGLNVCGKYLDASIGEKFVENKRSEKKEYAVLYKTGDYVRIKDDCIVFQGRTDSMIKVRGQRFDMSEVDHVMQEIESITKSVTMVTGRTDTDVEMVTFYTVEAENGPDLEQKINEAFEKFLPSYIRPTLHKLDEMPLQGQTGKVDRQALLKLINKSDDLIATATEIVAAALSEAKAKLANEAKSNAVEGIIAKELGINSSDIKYGSSFFELGGNSLNAAAVVVALRKEGFTMDIPTLVGAKSIEDVIKVASGVSKQSDGQNEGKFEIVPLDDSTSEEIRTEVAKLHALGYHEKNPIVSQVTTLEALTKFFSANMKVCIETGLSNYVKDQTSDKIVASGMHIPMESEMSTADGMDTILTMIDELERPAAKYLERIGGRWFFSYSNVVDNSLQDDIKVYLMDLLEKDIRRIAEEKEFDGIFTLNMTGVTNHLTSLMNYEELFTVVVNTYEMDGKKLWAELPDSETVQCSILRLADTVKSGPTYEEYISSRATECVVPTVSITEAQDEEVSETSAETPEEISPEPTEKAQEEPTVDEAGSCDQAPNGETEAESAATEAEDKTKADDTENQKEAVSVNGIEVAVNKESEAEGQSEAKNENEAENQNEAVNGTAPEENGVLTNGDAREPEKPDIIADAEGKAVKKETNNLNESQEQENVVNGDS